MSERHVVVGAGPVGQATAELLAGQVHEVLLVSLSGRGPELSGVRREASDAADTERLSELATGAVALYNCVNPPSYDVWPTYWPPIAEAFLQAAERSGATLVTAANLYPYGPVEGPMVEGLPDVATTRKAKIRSDMWAEARARMDAGRLTTVDVRASDYVGPKVTEAMGHVARVAPDALQGRTVRVIGRADVPHSFTDVRDVARTLTTVAVRPETWGRVWHVPTNPARTQAETLADVCRSVGRAPGTVKTVPHALIAALALFKPLMRELLETEYQFARPYVLDSTLTQRELGLAPTPWEEVCRATAENALATR